MNTKLLMSTGQLLNLSHLFSLHPSAVFLLNSVNAPQQTQKSSKVTAISIFLKNRYPVNLCSQLKVLFFQFVRSRSKPCFYAKTLGTNEKHQIDIFSIQIERGVKSAENRIKNK